jgi:phosphoribosylformimino-5-aminoimidazole carboxamide ribotide isomerase
MMIFPAIDLKDAQCVRLRQGAFEQSTVFNSDAAAQARAFEAAGFKWLHVVDLNGAVSGTSVNGLAVRDILSAIKIPVQLGGGIRDLLTIDSWLSAGISRVILGTAAVRNPALVSEAARNFPGRIAIGIDARNGLVAVDGWTRQTSTSAVDVARRYQEAGVAAIIYTDIARDGMLGGVNVAETAGLARAVSVPVIASGGVSSPGDIRALKESGAPIAGAIIGRALYDGRITPAEALDAAA